MMKNILIAIIVLSTKTLCAQTVGVINSSGRASEKLVLMAPLMHPSAYLLNKCGEAVHTWNFDNTNGPMYLLDNGNLIKVSPDPDNKFKVGGVGGFIDIYSWNSEKLASYKISTESEVAHHEIVYLDNGNILVNLWSRISEEEAVLRGRNPDLISFELLPEKIIEIKPIDDSTYEIVWEWDSWDHLIQDYNDQIENYGDVQAHPERIDINYVGDLASGRDWMHFNSLDYLPDEDLIVISNRHFNEIWVIDHSTTLEESKGHSGGRFGMGGDLLFRWGNPRTYHSEIDNQRLFGQHDTKWVSTNEGYAIKVFNNGFGTTDLAPGSSSVEMIPVNFDVQNGFEMLANGTFGPESADVLFAPGSADFYSTITSGSDLIENENFLVTLGATGAIMEVDFSSGETLWEYINPVIAGGPINQGESPYSPDANFTNALFKAINIPLDHPALVNGLEEDPVPLELNPVENHCMVLETRFPDTFESKLFPTVLTGSFINYDIGNNYNDNSEFALQFYDIQGRMLKSYMLEEKSGVLQLDEQYSGLVVAQLLRNRSQIATFKLIMN